MASSRRRSPPDEGYSEHPLTAVSNFKFDRLPQWLADMSSDDRTEYIVSMMSTLPTSEVWDIVRRVRPRLKIDFFLHLPSEICLRILSFLDPVSLIRTASASRHWQMLALDRKLWENLYILDGFRMDRTEVINFEESLREEYLEQCSIEMETERSASPWDINHASKRRATSQRILSISDDEVEMSKQNIQEDYSGEDAIMVDAPNSPENIKFQPSPVSPQENPSRQSQRSRRRRIPQPTKSTLTVQDRSNGQKRLNWHHLYSQRRRLEANWETGKYTNFQLPHPHYPEEGHTECIYTIQHSGNYLVSGSRDQTLRIWNLDTRRLALPPLARHIGSVLCLQFDPDPEEDIIVSGSSDATVIIWRFSTGQVVQRLTTAHRESVLNVKFDKRVLVTCSKDKTIKVFNRKPLRPGEPGNPVEDAPSFHLNNLGYDPHPSAGLRIKEPYSHIRTLIGHGAAVNAVQIHGDEIVSASGDRTVKVWNWPNNTCVRTMLGHTKGIACVQYDGRRIVSGSSDNEVKVFDKESGLEVASLRGHTNLVRTVQAGFGDRPCSEEEDKENAKKIDHEYFQAVDSGAISRESLAQRGRPRNAGSQRPEDITAYGAKLPPGGGGGKYSRIVSGSYDETIVIWRRDKQGNWKAQHTFRQEEASRAAIRAMANVPKEPNTNPAMLSSTAAALSSPIVTLPPNMPDLGPDRRDYWHAKIDMAVVGGALGLRQALKEHPNLLQYDHLKVAIDRLPDHTRRFMNMAVASAFQSAGQPVPPHFARTTPKVATEVVPIPPAAPGVQHSLNQPTHARVFKLQFDARRIICCSQTATIVGWDFANDDKDIIEASRFFAPME
ncbi:hypothetical protein ACMFMG_009900 [Clarireedia jacksonii]